MPITDIAQSIVRYVVADYLTIPERNSLQQTCKAMRDAVAFSEDVGVKRAQAGRAFAEMGIDIIAATSSTIKRNMIQAWTSCWKLHNAWELLGYLISMEPYKALFTAWLKNATEDAIDLDVYDALSAVSGALAKWRESWKHPDFKQVLCGRGDKIVDACKRIFIPDRGCQPRCDYMQFATQFTDEDRAFYLGTECVLKSMLGGLVTFEQWALARRISVAIYTHVANALVGLFGSVYNCAFMERVLAIEPDLFTEAVLRAIAASDLGGEFAPSFLMRRLTWLQTCRELFPAERWSLITLIERLESPGFPASEIMETTPPSMHTRTPEIDAWRSRLITTRPSTLIFDDNLKLIQAKYRVWARKRASPLALDAPPPRKRRKRSR